MKLSTSPVDALFSNAVLVTGCEDDPEEPGAVRLYVGPRSDWAYVLVKAEDAGAVRAVWAAGSMGHVFGRFDSPDEAVFQDITGRAAARSDAGI